MIAVAAATCGVAGFVPPLWAARQRPHDEVFRRRMHIAAGSLFGLMAAGTFFTAIAGEDSTGEPTGFLSDLGATLLVINLVLAVTVAVLVRKADIGKELPGVAEHLAMRRLREEYRELARRDPSLARSMRIGRPDLPRGFDDGGLLDLNTIPADRLGPLAGLTPEEVGRLTEARTRLGRFDSSDEVALYADLDDATAASLRERAVFF